MYESPSETIAVLLDVGVAPAVGARASADATTATTKSSLSLRTGRSYPAPEK
jgi:hypothetical protein